MTLDTAIAADCPEAWGGTRVGRATSNALPAAPGRRLGGRFAPLAALCAGWARAFPGRRRLRALVFELEAAEARERERIANGLHDDLGPMFALMKLRLGELSQGGHATGLATVDELRGLVTEAAKATRRATFELQSPVLQQQGLQAALEGLVQRMQRTSGTSISLHGELAGLRLPDAARAIAFRVVRELLANALKHGHARRIVVTLADDRHGLQVEVADDGRGFQRPAGAWRFSPEGGYGLHSAEAQARAVGGRLTVLSAPGAGSRIQLWLPLPAPRGSVPGIR